MRVVITGVGAVTPVGNSAASTFQALVEGRSGVRRIPGLDERFSVRIAADVKDLDPARMLGRNGARHHARFTHLCVAAAREALTDAGLLEAGYAPARVGTIIGTGLGGLEVVQEATLALERRGPDAISPFTVPSLIPNMAAGLLAIEANAQGPSYCTASACASSAHAIGEALELMRRGVVDSVLTGGGEACLTPLAIAAFANMRALSTRNDDPEKASRPFDRGRDGFVLGEGAGALVLETLAAARRRGARIYAELAGYGASADAFHITRPSEDGRGYCQAMRRALDDARAAPADVGYINAHGTSTLLNDVTETKAIRSAFGDHASSLWVSSTKSMTGHLLGGAGAVEAVVSALAIATGVVPPTINLDEPDPECDLDYVAGSARERRLGVAMTNSFGFGGQNVSLVLRAPGEGV